MRKPASHAGSKTSMLPLMICAVLAYECSHLVCRTAIYEALAEVFLGGIEKRAKEKGIVAEPAP